MTQDQAPDTDCEHLTPSAVQATFADNLRRLIDEKHRGNLSEFSRTSGIGRAQIQRYLSEGRFPAVTPLTQILNHFGCDGRILHLPYSPTATQVTD